MAITYDEAVVDLHGMRPEELGCRYGYAEDGSELHKLVEEAWKQGKTALVLIHGHGRNRGFSPGFVNTNTGFFGLCIRRALRNRKDKTLGQWIVRSSLNCSDIGCTSIRLKPHRNERQVPNPAH